MSSKVRLKMLVHRSEKGVSQICFKNMAGGLRPFHIERVLNGGITVRIEYLVDDGFLREWYLRCFSIIDYKLYEKKC